MDIEDFKAQSSEALELIHQHFGPAFLLMDDVADCAARILTAGTFRRAPERELDHQEVTLVASILAKAFKTLRAIRATAYAGCGHDASILLRALFESMIAVLYILQEDTRRRALLYVAHQNIRTRVAMEQILKTPGQEAVYSPEQVLKIRERAERWRTHATEADLESVRRHWAGPGGLEGATKALGPESGWHRVYNTLYRHTSAFSHGADAGSHITLDRPTNVPMLRVLPSEAELGIALPTACHLLLYMLGVFLERSGNETDAEIARLQLRVQELGIRA